MKIQTTAGAGGSICCVRTPQPATITDAFQPAQQLEPLARWPQSCLNPVEIPVNPALAAAAKVQNIRSRALLDSHPLRAAIVARAAELTPGNAPVKSNYSGGEFGVIKGSLWSETGLLVDATKLPSGAAVTNFQASPDGQKMAYGYAVNGSDWETWNVISMAGQPMDGPFFIKNTGVDGPNWDLDSKGFYYQGCVTAALDDVGVHNPQVKYHRLGTDSAQDLVLFQDPDAMHTVKFNAYPLDSDRAVVARTLGAAETPLGVSIVSKSGESTTLLKPTDVWGRFTGTDGSKVLLRTSQEGGKYGIQAIDANTGARTEVVPPDDNNVLIQAQQIGDKLVLQYLDPDLKNLVIVTNLQGQEQSRWLPDPPVGTLSLLTGNATSQAGYFTYSAAEKAPETYRFDVASATIKLVSGKPVPFDGSQVKHESRTFLSSDGTPIPMQLYTRTDLKDPPDFAYLAIYGNIGIANLPSFNKKIELMLELNGAVALANIPGGGEFGADWQKAGVFDKPQQVKQLAETSEFLKEQFPSIGDKVALYGRSYGGMMTMSAYTHYPDSFGLFVPVVGVSDPESLLTKERGWIFYDDLGFHRDRRGDVINSADHHDLIASWSPIEAVPKLDHAPPIMAFSGQFDTRVGSAQTLRFTQALQARFGDSAPVYQIEHENIGHNGRAEAADEATFVAQTFDLKDLRPLKPTP